MIQLQQVIRKEVWKEWEVGHPDLSFLQTWEWGEFQRSAGHEPVRWQIFEQSALIGQVQGFEHRLFPGVSYLYIPRMPAVSGSSIDEMVKIARESGIDFLRIEPAEEAEGEFSVSAKKIKSRQPAQTLILSLLPNEEELLAGMHAKTRYNIRVAQKHGVRIDTKKDATIFSQLNVETTERDRFKSHESEYYAGMLALDEVYQFTAYADDMPIASIICAGAGNTYTYVHGASSNAMRNVMAPYLLQWEAIRFAKQNGFATYDFWGIAPFVEKTDSDAIQCAHGKCWNNTHPWSGITRFKVGFGGEYREYPPARELVCNRLVYGLFNFIKSLKH